MHAASIAEAALASSKNLCVSAYKPDVWHELPVSRLLQIEKHRGLETCPTRRRTIPVPQLRQQCRPSLGSHPSVETRNASTTQQSRSFTSAARQHLPPPLPRRPAAQSTIRRPQTSADSDWEADLVVITREQASKQQRQDDLRSAEQERLYNTWRVHLQAIETRATSYNLNHMPPTPPSRIITDLFDDARRVGHQRYQDYLQTLKKQQEAVAQARAVRRQELPARIDSLASTLTTFRAHATNLLHKARKEDRRYARDLAAWQRFQRTKLLPLNRRLSVIVSNSQTLDRQTRELCYSVHWWQWRARLIDMQFQEAYTSEQHLRDGSFQEMRDLLKSLVNANDNIAAALRSDQLKFAVHTWTSKQKSRAVFHLADLWLLSGADFSGDEWGSLGHYSRKVVALRQRSLIFPESATPFLLNLRYHYIKTNLQQPIASASQHMVHFPRMYDNSLTIRSLLFASLLVSVHQYLVRATAFLLDLESFTNGGLLLCNPYLQTTAGLSLYAAWAPFDRYLVSTQYTTRVITLMIREQGPLAPFMDQTSRSLRDERRRLVHAITSWQYEYLVTVLKGSAGPPPRQWMTSKTTHYHPDATLDETRRQLVYLPAFHAKRLGVAISTLGTRRVRSTPSAVAESQDFQPMGLANHAKRDPPPSASASGEPLSRKRRRRRRERSPDTHTASQRGVTVVRKSSPHEVVRKYPNTRSSAG